MSELTDGQNRPLLVPDVAAPDTYRFRGKEIVVLSNNTLATATKKIPFYIGSIADYVAFFERMGVEIAVSTDFLFDKYATALRCVERFGVVADDTVGVIVGVTVAVGLIVIVGDTVIVGVADAVGSGVPVGLNVIVGVGVLVASGV